MRVARHAVESGSIFSGRPDYLERQSVMFKPIADLQLADPTRDGS